MSRTMPRIYVIGPFRAASEYERRANIARAEATALQVARAGALYRCPHLHSAHFDGVAGLDDTYWLALGLDLLSECDAAVLVPGWERYLHPDNSKASHGSIAERNWCAARGKPVLACAEDVPAFVRQWKHDHSPEAVAARMAAVRASLPTHYCTGCDRPEVRVDADGIWECEHCGGSGDSSDLGAPIHGGEGGAR